MIAYKGFNKELKSILGNGIKEKCTFEPGKTYTEENSKTGKHGYHCCENPFACLGHYSFDGSNRFFQVEAAGNLDEDDSERITCTKMTLLKELTAFEFAYAGMVYMIEHPNRDHWEQNRSTVVVKEDTAEMKSEKGIAIARGKNPKVKGVPGSILGLIVEAEPGIIENAKLFISKKDTWMELTQERVLQEVTDEEKID